MSYTTPIQFEVANPVGVDEKVAEIQTALKTASLSWNEYSFGRAYKYVRMKDGGKVYYPAVYQGRGKDYLSTFPNDNMTNYSFVYVRSPQDLSSADEGIHTYEAKISIILVFQFAKITTNYDNRFIERLKYDVIEALKLIPDLIINQVFDDIEDCFADFSTEEVESQFISDQYGALRFDCDVRYQNECLIENTYA